MVAPSWLREVPLAHRGLHGPGVAENSLSAFLAAAAAGYGVELDVRLSADGIPVVFHDRSLARLTGADHAVSELSASSLARMRLLDGDEGVPTLAGSLDVLRDVPVMVELKSLRVRPGALEAAVARDLATHPGPVCVAGFNPGSLRWFRRTVPEVPRVLTAMAPSGGGLRARILRRMAQLRDVEGVAPAAVSFDLQSLPHPAARRWRDDGGVLVTWTVTDEGELRHARDVADNFIFEDIRPSPGPRYAPGSRP